MLHIASAMTAGMASTSLTNPVWVIKTRFMVRQEKSECEAMTNLCINIVTE